MNTNDQTFTTRDEAIDQVIIPAIEAGDSNPADYDVDAIADQVLGGHDEGYAQIVDEATFWEAVADNQKPTVEATFEHVGADVNFPALDKAAHEIQAAILAGDPLPTTAAGHPVCGAESLCLDADSDYWLASFETDGVYVAGDPTGQFPDADEWPCIQILTGDREAMSGLLAKYEPSF